MRIRLQKRVSTTLSTAVLVVLATIMLDACGPGDSSSAASSTPDTSESQSAATQSPLANSARIMPLPTPDTNTAANTLANASTNTSTNPSAIPAYGANAATAANTASDPVQGAQASLAADSDQVTPVLSYAPGDSAQTQASNGNDPSSPATSSH
ncbi:hypothetical protein E1N52_03290 [Paraburkholderia guartelaensis]|uniref:Lipoprotein n=1 Tax=Paraburkholderia guartelaensis TaxID=2546446 RepID=A0A4R5LL19_9BURK|nr:hypothetical protein [Paraburkholderia guartelaensis]TDG10385.1 hypothetical protein E1N52_03290 [Paraburkholderia guartelaensis]